MKQILNQSETKALCDALSFLSMICIDFKPEHFETAMKQLKTHREVLRDLTNDEVANHFDVLCEIRIGEVLIQHDF